MKKEIKINDSRLKLVCLEPNVTSPLNDKITVKFDKKKMKYQFIGLVENDGTKDIYSIVHCGGVSKKTIARQYEKFPEIWYIGKGDRRYSVDEEEYTQEELKLIIAFIFWTVQNEFLDTAEILCHATKDSKIIKGFYGMYGKTGKNNYLRFLLDILKYERNYEVTPIEGYIPRCYDRNRYSIQKLIKELIEDKSKILVDPELIGRYNRITGEKLKKESGKIDNTKWYPITGILGNRTRANISLQYNSDILVNIPQNPYDIAPGTYKFKKKTSLCIIKDGQLNLSCIGATLSPKLAGKLKRLGFISSDLVRDGEYLIDLTRLPVISKSWIRGISSNYLARLEVDLKLSTYVLEYINTIYPPVGEKDNEKSDREKFLNSLGIYGDMFIPCNKDFERNSTYSRYRTVELISTISNLNLSKGSRAMSYEYYHSGNKAYGDYFLNQYFDYIDIEKKCQSDLEGTRNEWSQKVRTLEKEMRDRKFQIIMGKKTRFTDGNDFIDSVTKTIEIIPGGRKVSVSWKFKEVTI